MRPVSRKRLEFATERFLAIMAQEYVRANPNEPVNPAKALRDYPTAQRSMVMRAVGSALKSCAEESDKSFEDWLERQAQEPVD